jgi:DNA-binding transcriptional LysR family regulator
MKTALNATNVRVFEAVVRLQSVTRAAEELKTSQPYVSKQIEAIEEQFNVQLFSRVGRRPYLTQPGEMLHQHTKVMMERLKDAEDMLLSSKSLSRKTLRIATTTTGMYMLPEWLATFHGKVTDMETTVIVTSGNEVEQKVISGDAGTSCFADLLLQDRAEHFTALRRSEGSGRPVGTAEFVTGLDRLLGRPVSRRTPGPKPANRVDGEQLELLQ